MTITVDAYCSVSMLQAVTKGKLVFNQLDFLQRL